MTGEVRNVSVRLSVDNAQAIAGLKQTGAAADQTANQMQRAGRTGGQAWTTIGRGARNTAIAGGIALAAIEKANLSFDKQMSAVDAATHETSRNLDLLRAAAIKAGADTQFSATEAAQGVTELAKAGVRTKAILGGGLKGALDLAAAGQISVAEAAETAASAMTQFQLKGKDVPHIADLLAAGAGKAQGSVHDLGQALNQSGLVASQTGLSIEDTTGTLAAFAKAGLLGSDAGTSFKTMLLSLNPRSAQAAKLMKQYNIEAYDAQGNFVGITKYAGKLRDGLKDLTAEQRQRAFSKIFGTDAIRAANILYRNGDRGIKQWIKNVDSAGYAADTAHRQTNNLSGDWERFTGSLEATFIKSGGGFQGGLRDAVQTAEKLVNKFGELPGAVQSGTVKILALVTGAAAVAYGVTKAVKGYDAIRGLTSRGLGKGAAGGLATGAASGVVPVYVTNLGPGGGLGGVAGKTGAGGAAVIPRGGKPSAGSRALKLGLDAIAVSFAAGIIVQVQEGLGKIGSPGHESGVLKPFQKPKTTASDKFLFGSGHTLKHDTQNALDAQKFGGVFSGIDQKLAGLIGGDSMTKSLKNVKELDKALAALNYRSPAEGAKAYNEVLKKSGLTQDQLAKVLPKTDRALFQQNAHMFAASNILQGATIPAFARYQRQLRSLPDGVATRISSPGFEPTSANITKLKRKYDLTPKQLRTLVRLLGGPAAIAEANRVEARLNRLQGKTIATYIRTITTHEAGPAKPGPKTLHGLLSPNHKDGGADGMTVPGRRAPYGDKILTPTAPGEEIISNRHGQADRWRPLLKAINRGMADGGTVGSAPVSGGTGTKSVIVSFPAPAVYAAAVKAADDIAVAAVKTTATARDLRAVHLDDLHQQQQIRDLQKSLAEHNKKTVGKGKHRHTVTGGFTLTGLDRKAAKAELADARATLAEMRKLTDAQSQALEAQRQVRTDEAATLASGDILARGLSPTAIINQVTRLTNDIGQFGSVVARLRGANASPALLSRMKALADSGDFRSAIRLGQALLDQPALLGQLNASLAGLTSASANVATLTTDPRFLSSAAWNPTGQVPTVQSTITVSPDPSAWMLELKRHITFEVKTQLGAVVN